MKYLKQQAEKSTDAHDNSNNVKYIVETRLPEPSRDVVRKVSPYAVAAQRLRNITRYSGSTGCQKVDLVLPRLNLHSF